MFHVVLRQAGPDFDPGLPLEEQTLWAEHAAYMDSLVEQGKIVLGGTLPDGRVAHAMEAASEDEVEAIWALDPWAYSHLLLESIEPWTIRLDGREKSS
ncbi:MAG TPA: YciI family protein [Gaiellaceae bacterium]|nr:YciI family protein [Gaiellaceae bacterium]